MTLVSLFIVHQYEQLSGLNEFAYFRTAVKITATGPNIDEIVKWNKIICIFFGWAWSQLPEARTSTVPRSNPPKYK